MKGRHSMQGVVQSGATARQRRRGAHRRARDYALRPRLALGQSRGVVAVTGSDGYWGARLLRLARQDPRLRGVVAIGRVPARDGDGGLRRIEAGIHDAGLAAALRREAVECLVHVDLRESFYADDAVFEHNVMGSMHLLSAAARAGVRKVVLMSSTQVYGAHPDNPAFLGEHSPLRAGEQTETLRDRLEVERFVARHAERHPRQIVTVLRFPGILGPGCRTEMSEYLRVQAVPTVTGFDPMLQVIHEEDVLRALLQAVRVDCPGVVNVAADPALPLHKVIRLAGRIPTPILNPLTLPWFDLARRIGVLRPTHLAMPYLAYPWVADNSRMGRALGFRPRYSAEEAIRAFARADRWERSRR